MQGAVCAFRHFGKIFQINRRIKLQDTAKSVSFQKMAHNHIGTATINAAIVLFPEHDQIRFAFFGGAGFDLGLGFHFQESGLHMT